MNVLIPNDKTRGKRAVLLLQVKDSSAYNTATNRPQKLKARL